jgi:hypothetical protein
MANMNSTPATAVAQPCAPVRMPVKLLAFSFLALALLFYYGSVLRVPLKQTHLLDLGPYPDAVEYFAQANSMLRHSMPTIQIGYDRLPSRYPPGYPVLMLPWLSFLPHNGIAAPFRANQTIGLLLLLSSCAFYFVIGRPLAGGLAPLLLATQPAFISYSRSSMSDLAGAGAVLCVVGLTYVGLTARRRCPIYIAAIVLGLSLSIRPQLLFFSPILVSIALLPQPVPSGKWLLHCVLVILTFALAASPYFILNTLQFGHPLTTGYDFWAPSFREQGAFSLRNIPQHLNMIRAELTLTREQFDVANLFGTGTYIVPAFMLLAICGLFYLRFSRFVISVFLAATVFLIATITFKYVDGRLYMPLQFLLVPLAVLPVESVIMGCINRRCSFAGMVLLFLFILSCIGYPSESDFKPKSGRAQAWDALHYANNKARPRRYEAQKEFSRLFRSAPGIVLSDIDPPYLNSLLPKPFIASPIDNQHNYCYSRAWRYGKPEAVQLVENGLRHATPVYALLLPSKDVDQDIKRLPSIQGYTWKRSEKSSTRALILILTKDFAAPTLDSVSRSVQ